MNNGITFLKQELPKFWKGDSAFDDETLKNYSHDASLFIVEPTAVLFPKDAEDVKAIVKFVKDNKTAYPELSISARSAGTCMSGGSLNNSIILDFTRHMGGIKALSKTEATVLPGTFYRDFEKETDKLGVMLPCYPASKLLCALGGMTANNCAGEKTLRYGKMEHYVKYLKIVLRDGNEYPVRPLSRGELNDKMAQRNTEGELYRTLNDIIEKNKAEIMAAKPDVSKNSAGYYLWNVWDGETFNLSKLLVGSQGTLGIITEITVELVPIETHSRLFVAFLPELSKLGNAINEILPLQPETVESYDDSTMKFALKYLPELISIMKAKSFFKLVFSFIPEALMLLTGGIPKLILLVEFSGNDEKSLDAKVAELSERMKPFKWKTRIAKSKADAEKYWTIRRESFSLLRKHVRGRRTAPFIDDVVVKPEYLPEFLPKIRAILDKYKLFYTIAGHAGNGNFHIIPLMDMHDPENAKAIFSVSEEVYDLVAEYKGSITGEHNDGIVRTPYLSKMFSPKILGLFRETKDLFDPQGIFNPGKKVGITKEYAMAHLAKQ